MDRLMSPLFRRSEKSDVQPGHSYRRENCGLTEKATVVDLKNDPLGIPHVRFQLVLERKFCDRVEKGFKILALQSFIEAYPERVA
jgi:hypothetical protein